MNQQNYVRIGYHFTEYLRLGNRYFDLDILKKYLTKSQYKKLLTLTTKGNDKHE